MEAGLDGSPVARTLRSWCAKQGNQGSWTGTASELLAQLTLARPDTAKAWPTSAKALTGQLKRLATGLRSTGIQISQLKSTDGNRRLIQIDWVGNHVSDLSDLSDDHKNQQLDFGHIRSGGHLGCVRN